MNELIKEQYCEWNNYDEQNALLLSSLKLAIHSIPSRSTVARLCNKLYFTCCNIKVLYNLRYVYKSSMINHQEGMPMTMREYEELSFPVVMARLLLQNKHLIALHICDIYNSHSNKQYQQEEDNYFDIYRGMITMDWATKKVNRF